MPTFAHGYNLQLINDNFNQLRFTDLHSTWHNTNSAFPARDFETFSRLWLQFNRVILTSQ